MSSAVMFYKQLAAAWQSMLFKAGPIDRTRSLLFFSATDHRILVDRPPSPRTI
ncbi:hypothetical protein X748_30425 [Mesorhizobium sp. LNJC386A00]|nr:hypothetical protein X748_30425 [Mesorhizobium sp. LNJC386A00]